MSEVNLQHIHSRSAPSHGVEVHLNGELAGSCSGWADTAATFQAKFTENKMRNILLASVTGYLTYMHELTLTPL